MRLSLGFLALLASAAPAVAEGWLSPEAFQAQVAGKATIVTDALGDRFGTEHFLPDRRVIWQYSADKSCLFGTWTPRRDTICYSYDGGLENCLRYRPDGTGLTGVEWNDGIEGETYRLKIIDAPPPNCPGS